MGPLTSHFFSQEDLVLYAIKRGDFDLKIWSGAPSRKELVCLIHWLRGLFRKNAFLDILEIFSLDMSPLSSNVLKKTFLTWYHSFLFTSTAFYDIFALERTNQKLVIGQESDLPLQAFRFFFLFFRLFLFPLSYLFYGGDSTGLASSPNTGMSEKASSGNFYYGAAKCSRGKFSCEFFTQVSEHFRAYLRLHWANHPDLIGKIFSSCRVQV